MRSAGRRRTAADDGDIVAGLLRQRLAGLLVDDVLGVPVWPVHIVLAGPLLVLAMRSRSASKRGREIGDRSEGRVSLHPAGQTVSHFLQQPAVAVRIAERSVRVVASTLRIRTADTDAPEQIGLVHAGERVVAAVERSR